MERQRKSWRFFPRADAGRRLARRAHGRAAMIEPILLAATRVVTFRAANELTNATGFFFERDDKLFLVTSRHVMLDEPSGHVPDRIEIDLHTDLDNMARSAAFSIPLYGDGGPLWREGADTAGPVDVTAIALDRSALPRDAAYRAFNPRHLVYDFDAVEVGTSLLVVGFPLGFHDTLHHMPVVRHAVIASSFGLRFQGQGYFLTDGRTHRGSSGAAVVARITAPGPAHGDLPWMLLGIHSSRIDIGTRDQSQDEALGLNSAWYADVLGSLTEERSRGAAP